MSSFGQCSSTAIKGRKQSRPFKKLHCLTVLQKGFLKIPLKGIFSTSLSPVRQCPYYHPNSQNSSQESSKIEIFVLVTQICATSCFFVWLEFHYSPSVEATRAGIRSSHPRCSSALYTAVHQTGLLRRYRGGSPAPLSEKHKWIWLGLVNVWHSPSTMYFSTVRVT